jgi:hypothetical protein
MKKQITLLNLLIALSTSSYAQVGIGTQYRINK